MFSPVPPKPWCPTLVPSRKKKLWETLLPLCQRKKFVLPQFQPNLTLVTGSNYTEFGY